MPLKQAVLPLLDEVDDTVARHRRPATPSSSATGTADGSCAGRNTDVDGIVRAVREVSGRADAPVAHVLGGGATAASAVLALRRLGCPAPVVHVRDPARAGAVAGRGRALRLRRRPPAVAGDAGAGRRARRRGPRRGHHARRVDGRRGRARCPAPWPGRCSTWPTSRGRARSPRAGGGRGSGRPGQPHAAAPGRRAGAADDRAGAAPLSAMRVALAAGEARDPRPDVKVAPAGTRSEVHDCPRPPRARRDAGGPLVKQLTDILLEDGWSTRRSSTRPGSSTSGSGSRSAACSSTWATHRGPARRRAREPDRPGLRRPVRAPGRRHRRGGAQPAISPPPHRAADRLRRAGPAGAGHGRPGQRVRPGRRPPDHRARGPPRRRHPRRPARRDRPVLPRRRRHGRHHERDDARTSSRTSSPRSARSSRTRRSSSTSTCSSPRRSRTGPPTSTSSRPSTTCGSATGSTACCTRSCARPRRSPSGVTSRLKIMCDIDIAERRMPQDGRLSITAQRPQDRPARRDAADGVGREGRHARPRQLDHAHGPAGPRLLRRATTPASQTSSSSPTG